MILAWGTKVSAVFVQKVLALATTLGVDPSWLMAVMAFESSGTFSPSVRNAAGSGAVGLIQFMDSTAQAMGTTTTALAAMTPEEQLDKVAEYFAPYNGRLRSLNDLYMAVLWPAAIGKSDDYVLFDQADPNHPKRYLQNKGLDFNHDGQITKAEAAAGPTRKLAQGLLVAPLTLPDEGFVVHE